MLVDVVAVAVPAPWRLRLRFEDGAEGELDVRELVEFDGVFEPLADPAYFEGVRVNHDLGTVAWPNGADIDPVVLYEAACGSRT